jgi:hypothetical protein
VGSTPAEEEAQSETETLEGGEDTEDGGGKVVNRVGGDKCMYDPWAAGQVTSCVALDCALFSESSQ